MFKHAESIFNLGIQLKAQPIAELESAQKNFRFSVAQRMLYNDESSKKRTISSLEEQRQQITSLSPHQNHPQANKRIKLDSQGDQFVVNEDQVAENCQQAQNDQYPSSNGEYQYASTSSDPGYVISSSLKYVYGDANAYAPVEEQQEEESHSSVVFTFEHGFQAPRNFVNQCRNSQEPWNVPLCLEEPYDPNQRCFYPKHLAYPGNGQEYSLEELKAQKWQEERQKQEELRIQTENLRQRQEQERLRQQQEAKRLIEEQERIRTEQEALRVRLEQEKIQREESAQTYQSQLPYQQPNASWNCHALSPASYGSYYQQSYENSPQYSYSHDHRYQSHLAQQQNLYQQSPQHYQNSPSYQNSPNYLQANPQQQASVIVNRNQYENQHAAPPQTQLIGSSYYQPPIQPPQYNASDYQPYHQPQTQVVQAAPANPPTIQKCEEPDYQDVEYLIDHQGEIDPNMLQQPIIESHEEGEDSSYDESDDEPYSGPAPVVNSYMLDDLEEQIEASTISFSSNGKSRDKKITIKFRKEKTLTTIINSESNSESSTPPVRSHTAPSTKSSQESASKSSSNSKKKSRKQKFQREILNTFDGDNTQFMPSATNSCSSTVNGEGNSSSFASVSFNGCVTPVRKAASKSSTPVSSYKFLKKPESVVSNQNDDSVCSFSGDQNSFFQAENDEDFKGRRMDRAVVTIDDHMQKRDIDPFSTELCRAFLTKLNFPNRENTTDYRITSTNLPKLTKNQIVPISGINYQIEKEVGRGSYGAVFR